MTKPAPKNPPPAAVMLNLLEHRVSHLVYVAAKLELADLLKDGPRTVEELATAAEVQAPALYRVLRALASLGVFTETKGKRFRLTPLAATLQKAVPGSMRAGALFVSLPFWKDGWAQLLHGVKTGEVPFRKAHGVPLFEYLQNHPEEYAIFNEAMTSLSSTENFTITAAYKFSGIRTLVDVGGGRGSLLAAILQANPKLKGVLFDLPAVIASAEQDRQLKAKGIGERCTFEAGSFFEALPKGGDAYMMKHVLHDWDDEQCVKILANCCAAMSGKGRVLVVESVIATGNNPDPGKLMDISMFIVGGRERTREEFAALYRKAGLKLTRVVPTKCPLSIVEGVRAAR